MISVVKTIVICATIVICLWLLVKPGNNGKDGK